MHDAQFEAPQLKHHSCGLNRGKGFTNRQMASKANTNPRNASNRMKTTEATAQLHRNPATTLRYPVHLH